MSGGQANECGWKDEVSDSEREGGMREEECKQ